MPENRASNWAWPAAFVVITSLLVFGALWAFNKGANALSNAFKRGVPGKTIIYSSVERMTREAKLVVWTTTFTVEIDKTNPATIKIFGKEIPRGTTTVHLRAHGNKAQYYVPLGGITKRDFTYDSGHKKFTLRVPAPVVDEDVVDIQSDPANIEIRTEVTWTRLDSRSGKFQRDEARKELRPTVIREAKKFLKQAEAEAQAVLKKLLQPLTDALKDDVQFLVEFK